MFVSQDTSAMEVKEIANMPKPLFWSKHAAPEAAEQK
jgi:hypothetical protein